MIADEVEQDIGVRVLFGLSQPVDDAQKSIVSRYIISQKHTMSTPIKNPRDRSEGFLSSSVPDLQLANFVLDLGDETAEFDADGHIVLFFELVVHYSGEKATLADA